MPAKLNTENTKSTEHTENREKRFTARTDIELSRLSPCPLCSSVNSVLNSEIVTIPKSYRKQLPSNVNT
jgi:hypothetical protein